MLPIDEALSRILAVARPLPDESVPAADALDRTLAEDVASDIDSPPYDKSLVDGYAVRSADFQRRPSGETVVPVELAVVEEVTAGRVPTVTLTAGHATRIMTGAPLPAGADAVVMVEQTHWHAESGACARGGVVRFEETPVMPGLGVLRRAAAMRRGQIALRSGTLIRPAEIGVLAEIGRRQVRVACRTRVAMLPTGNELVDASLVPALGQIRNSNGPMLIAAVRRAGATPLDLGIGRDDHEQLRSRIVEGLRADVLLISGGVSTGVLDLVPGVLKELGVEEVFHKVAVRPGMPLWFGTGRSDAGSTLVFGLPGNPVGALVCFELFVTPALLNLAGRESADWPLVRARLADEYQHRGPRTTYHPARLRFEGPTPIIAPVAWQGSADLRALSEANAWAIFPPGQRNYAAGEEIDCRAMR